jgi:Na+/melibiose symporter-like transporter
MATKANDKRSARQGSVSSGGGNSYSVPLPDVLVNRNGSESQMGFLIGLIVMCVVFALMLPLMAFMYIDILEAKKETQHQQKQIQKLINEAKEK